MKLAIMSDKGTAAAEMEVADAVFGTEFNEPLVHQIVVAHQAAGRSATRAQKTRSQVRGGGRKPYRQKGTGQARAGTIRSPLWRGGGKIFPASPDENFVQKVNRKMYRGAMRAILSELARQGRLLAVREFNVAEPKTKGLATRLQAMGADDVLIVADAIDRNLTLAARNLRNVGVCTVAHADPVALIRHEKVIMTQAALKRFEEMLA